MTVTEILTNIENKAYDAQIPYCTERQFPGNHIFDREQTVAWNEMRVAEENARIIAAKEAYRESERLGRERFEQDLADEIVEDYGLNEQQAKVVVGQAYVDGHALGYGEVLRCATELATFACNLLRLA